MYTCEECDAKTNKLFDDYRCPPLNDHSCLCKTCYINALRDSIEEKKEEIDKLHDLLDSVY